jgi:hypothetical protein
MSTAQVVNSGIVGVTARVAQPRASIASSAPFIDPTSGAYAPPPRDQASRYDDGSDDFETPRRRRRGGGYQADVVSFGGVLVSREVGATIMKEQMATQSRDGAMPFGVDAERSVKIYEFNQALMGTAEILTDTGLSHS